MGPLGVYGGLGLEDDLGVDFLFKTIPKLPELDLFFRRSLSLIKLGTRTLARHILLKNENDGNTC